MKMRHITWQEFDEFVASYPKPICDSFYPVPRGGYCLAVALSHRFGIPLVDSPKKLSIIVDDIADSGKTLSKIRLRYGSLPAYVLVARKDCREKAITAGLVIEDEDWIVFPWENKEKAIEDYEEYVSRK